MIVYEAMYLPPWGAPELLGVWGTLSEAQAACNRHAIREENGKGRDLEGDSIDFGDAIKIDMKYGTWPYALESHEGHLEHTVMSLHQGNHGEYQIIGYDLSGIRARTDNIEFRLVVEGAADAIAALHQLHAQMTAMLAKLPPPTDQPEEMLRRALYGDEETT